MKVVLKGNKTVIKLLGKQSVFKDKSYRKNSFCILSEVDGSKMAYSTLTCELAELTADEYDILSKETVCADNKCEELIEKWWLVPLDHDDIKLCDEMRSFMKLFEKNNGIKSYTIFTTMDCNARCFYCFEHGKPKPSMSAQTAEDVVEFIKRSCDRSDAIGLQWFGGEPLYNSGVIDIITDGVRNAGIDFASKMTTNGFLFSEALVKKAVDKWNLKKLQITLDGTEEIYNKTKAYINCDGLNPFKIVTDNIELLRQNGIKVYVRVNLGEHNKEDLFELAKWMSNRYPEKKGIVVYAHLLYDSKDYALEMDKKTVLANSLLEFRAYCISLGFAYTMDIHENIKVNRCMADADNAVVITPDGNLGKCEHFSDSEYIGNVRDGITDKDMVQSFKEVANTKEICEGCSAYPVCIQLKKCSDLVFHVCDSADRMLKETNILRSAERIFIKSKSQESHP